MSTPLRKVLVATAAAASSLLLAGGAAMASTPAPAATPSELPICGQVHEADAVIFEVLMMAGLCEASH